MLPPRLFADRECPSGNLPGHIQVGDRPFRCIFDPPNQDSLRLSLAEYDLEIPNESTGMHEQEHALDPRGSKRWLRDITPEVRAMERSGEDELVVFLETSLPDEPPRKLRLGYVTYMLLKRTGLVKCGRSHCDGQPALPCARVRSGWRMPETDESTRSAREDSSSVNPPNEPVCFIWPPLPDAARCMVINEHSKHQLFLRHGDCTSCCTISILHARNDGVHRGMKQFLIL